MKRLTLVSATFLAVMALSFIMPIHSYGDDMATMSGCVYNKKTGAKISAPFIVRFWSKDGNGGASSGMKGCYDMIELNNSGAVEWDYIEVIVKKKGKFYTQQYKLPPKSIDMGMDFLDLPPGDAKYDFYLDIVD